MVLEQEMECEGKSLPIILPLDPVDRSTRPFSGPPLLRFSYPDLVLPPARDVADPLGGRVGRLFKDLQESYVEARGGEHGDLEL